MIPKLPSEKFWKLYKNLPQELQEVLLSEKTGEEVRDICQRYGILEIEEEILDLVGLTLIGLLPFEDLKLALERDLKLSPQTAKQIAQEIFRFIFFPVKSSLEKIYKIEMKEEKETLKEAKKEDIYREPIE
jgi:hypothetical protein